MESLYVMLRHDFEGLGKKGKIVTKKAFDTFVREQIYGLEDFLKRSHQEYLAQVTEVSRSATPEAPEDSIDG